MYMFGNKSDRFEKKIFLACQSSILGTSSYLISKNRNTMEALHVVSPVSHILSIKEVFSHQVQGDWTHHWYANAGQLGGFKTSDKLELAIDLPDNDCA